jgi:predicted metal-dependent phosphoesterase TrpH
MNSDLHIHTKYSDGELDEYEIIKEVINSNIKEFSICDHDTIEGSERVYNVLKTGNYEVEFHSGVELSSRYKNFNIHLLVRDFDFDDQNIVYLVDKIAELRKERINVMLKLVNDIYGVDIKFREVEEVLKTTNSFGKPHLYKILSRYGSYDREEYYRNMDKLNSDNYKLDAIEVLLKLKDSKGYVTLAHPIEVMKEYNLTYNNIDELVNELSKIGLKGLETKHSNHTLKDYLEFSKIAKKYNLIETTGSDFHGEGVKPGLKIGMIEKR